jgi:hypothetical protein
MVLKRALQQVSKLFFTYLVADSAGSFTGRLTGSLALTAASALDCAAQIPLNNGYNMFSHDFSS